MEKYFEILKAHIMQKQPDFGDGESVLLSDLTSNRTELLICLKLGHINWSYKNKVLLIFRLSTPPNKSENSKDSHRNPK